MLRYNISSQFLYQMHLITYQVVDFVLNSIIQALPLQQVIPDFKNLFFFLQNQNVLCQQPPAPQIQASQQQPSPVLDFIIKPKKKLIKFRQERPLEQSKASMGNNTIKKIIQNRMSNDMQDNKQGGLIKLPEKKLQISEEQQYFRFLHSLKSKRLNQTKSFTKCVQNDIKPFTYSYSAQKINILFRQRQSFNCSVDYKIINNVKNSSEAQLEKRPVQIPSNFFKTVTQSQRLPDQRIQLNLQLMLNKSNKFIQHSILKNGKASPIRLPKIKNSMLIETSKQKRTNNTVRVYRKDIKVG